MEDFNKIKMLWVLSKIKYLGNISLRKLTQDVNNLDEFYNKKFNNIKHSATYSNRIIQSLIETETEFKKYDNEFTKMIEFSESNSIKIISIFDDKYPQNLREIYDAPVLLYYKGKLDNNNRDSISVIGTRYPSEYGIRACTEIVRDLSLLNIPIISGLARGIDSIAHKAAIENSNITYAILGCGINVVYPRENLRLYEKIIENGVIISEFEINASPDKINFPRRNRIISGISLGTLIIESGKKGGSLITSEFALDQGREVFAVPGNIFSRKSEGCNELIKRGQAKAICSVNDILSEINTFSDLNKAKVNFKKIIPELNVFERKILDILKEEPLHIDYISSESCLSISDCLVNLLSLEFKSLIKQLPGKYFIKIGY